MSNKKNNKKQDKDSVLLDALEKFSVENKDIPKLHMIISDYLAKNKALRTRYADIKEKVQKTIEENSELDTQFQRENVAKREEFESLQENFKNLQVQNMKRVAQFEVEKRNELAKIEEDFHSLLAEKEKKIDELKNLKLISYEDIKRKENDLLARIEALKKANENSELSHHDKMREFQKNFEKQKNNISSIHKAEIEKFLKNASTTAQRTVLENEATKEDENKLLLGETTKFQKELDILKKERARFMQENRVYAREIALADEGLEQYHSVNQRQNDKIKQAKEKIEFLKNFISQEVIKYTKDIELERFRHQSLMKEYEFQIQALKEHLQSKSDECKSMRMLANRILRQREDIEEFFLDSIEQIRESKGDKSSFEGESRGKYSERVDISELSLEDREKILRIIFAKINNGVALNGTKGWNEQKVEEDMTIKE